MAHGHIAGVIWILGLLLVAYVSDVAGHVYRCALYKYATEGVVPEPYNQDLLEHGLEGQKERREPVNPSEAWVLPGPDQAASTEAGHCWVWASHVLREIHAPDAIQLQTRSAICGRYTLCVERYALCSFE